MVDLSCFIVAVARRVGGRPDARPAATIDDIVRFPPGSRVIDEAVALEGGPAGAEARRPIVEWPRNR